MTFEQYILQQRPLCELPFCGDPSVAVLDPHTPEMLVVCRRHADLVEDSPGRDEANEPATTQPMDQRSHA